jgi:hypothetical protein
MNTSRLSFMTIVVATCVASGDRLFADTTPSFGAGSAGKRVDRTATFDALNQNGIPISDYTEGLLFLGVDGDSQVDFDPFHGVDGMAPTFEFPTAGSYGWVTINATDGKSLRAVEFMYGNGWTTGSGAYPWGNNLAYLEWQTWLGGKLVSSGTIGGSGQVIEMGTIIGFHDDAGFDQLLVRCKIATSVDPDLQALALDNVNVEMSEQPALWWNYGAGWPGLLGVPGFVASNPPVLGGGLDLSIDNSAPYATVGLMLIGSGETSLPTKFGGSVVVGLPWTMVPLDLPRGKLDLAGFLPDDPTLSGTELDLQCLEFDPFASGKLSFTPGLALLLGY